MKLFANRKIKALFVGILLCISITTLISALLVVLEVRNAALLIMILYLCMSIAILILCYIYFKEQHKIGTCHITDYRICIRKQRGYN